MDDNAKQNRLNYGKMVSRCWEDEDLKKRLIESTAEVLAEFELPVEEGVTYKVIEAPKMVQYIVVPYENAIESIQQISKSLLQRAEDFPTNILPGGLEVRLIQDTKDVRHIILPFPVQLLTLEDAIALGLKFGGTTATNTDVITNLYAISQATATDIVGAVTEALLGVFVAAGAVIVLI